MNSRGGVILSRDLPDVLQPVSGDKGSRRSRPKTRSEKTPETSIYQNLLDLPITVFCQFISDAAPDITDKQIALWWKEFSKHRRDRAYMAKRKIEDYRKEYYTTTELDVPKLTEYIKVVIDDTISQFSKFRHSIETEPIEEAEPVCIRGKTQKESLTAILREILKEYGGNKEKAVKELRTSLNTLDRWLLYRVEDDRNKTNNSSEETAPILRQIERFPIDEIMRLHTELIKHFILDNLSRAEWRNKELNGQMRTVHLALKVLSKRLEREHGCIYFGGLTFSRIEWNIYRRAPYLYADDGEAAEVLKVSPTTFKKHWGENKPFPSHHTLFTG